MEGQPPRLAARGRDDEDIEIAIVFAGEGEPLAVGREMRIEFEAGAARDAASLAAFAADDPQIAGERERDLVRASVGFCGSNCLAGPVASAPGDSVVKSSMASSGKTRHIIISPYVIFVILSPASSVREGTWKVAETAAAGTASRSDLSQSDLLRDYFVPWCLCGIPE